MRSKIKLLRLLGHSYLSTGGIFASEQDFFLYLNPHFSQNWASEPLSQGIYHIFNMFITKPQRPKNNSIQLNILMLALVLTEETEMHCHF